VTLPERSRIMRAVKSKDTKPERLVRSLLHQRGYRYRLHRADLPGRPDLAFPARKKVVFVNGCYWHGHDCRRGARQPKANAEYWREKISRNRERDAANMDALNRLGWSAIVVWECELRAPDIAIERLLAFLGHPRFDAEAPSHLCTPFQRAQRSGAGSESQPTLPGT